MATSEEMEVYRQRYETYRHLDKLRWQMVQISVAIAPVVIAFGAKEDGSPTWWVLATAGLLLIIFGWVMEKIRQGINANAQVLADFGERLGDNRIPNNSSRSKSSSYFVSVAIRLMGGVTLIWAGIKLLE